ncbi:MAG: hypothetical protein HY300_08130 [Verrucomicrobia bacterium]|nr:hypothetical protein [Verrucomicrobiota bacterium]
MKLSQLSILLGLGYAVPQVFALMKPAQFRDRLRKFPRSESWGWALMLLAVAWFLLYLREENNGDISRMKPYLSAGFVALGIATCLFVKDFLAVRGLALVLMLAAKLILDVQRWNPSQWRLVLAVMAYVWIVAGIWWTVSPWRLRDLIEWVTATEKRIRYAAFARLAFGVLLVVLGLTQF